MVHYNTDREWENYIQEVRVERGLTISELAEKAETSSSQLVQLMSGIISPLYQIGRRKGLVKPWVERICVVLNVEPEHMFPREICPIEDPSLKGFCGDQIDEITLSDYHRGHSDGSAIDKHLLKKSFHFLWRSFFQQIL